MNIRETLIAAAVGASLLSSTATAGGPVIVEDAYEAEPQARNKAGWIVPVVILLIIAAAASGGSKGGGVVCNGEDPQPEPDGGC